MNKNRNKLVFLLTAFIFIGFLILSVLSYQDYSYLIEEDLYEITELISTNVSLEIDNELTKPLFVSKILAGDFLCDTHLINEDDPQVITDILQSTADEYEFDTAFFISSKTENYYLNDGTVMQLDSSDPSSFWYYRFLEKGADYEFSMERKAEHSEDLTLNLLYALKKEDSVLGVVGIGIEISKIQDILNLYESELDGDIFLSNSDGTIQIHTENWRPVKDDLFEEGFFDDSSEEIHESGETPFNFTELPLASDGSPPPPRPRDAVRVFSPDEMEDSFFMGTYYLEDIDMNLVVRQNYILLDDLLFFQRIRTIVIFSISFLLLTILVIVIANRYHKKNTKFVKTDYLTEIYNRNAFDEALKHAVAKNNVSGAELTLAIIDVDNFKAINDEYGHVEGDKILISTAEHLKSHIRSEDIVARWGGDEFAIIFTCNITETESILTRIKDTISKNSILSGYSITYSVGITQCASDDDAKSLLKRADEALYSAKEKGKNRIFRL